MAKKKISVGEEMDFFSTPLLQTSILNENIVEFYPLTPILDGEPIEFTIPPSFTQMTDPNIMLKVKVKTTEADGTALKDAAKVAPTNLLLHALFRDVVLKANGVVLTQASSAYPYRTYIETNFTYSSSAKNGAVGIPQQFYVEKTGKFNAVTAGENISFDQRKTKFAKGVEVELCGRIHCDFLLQPKLVIPGVHLFISLYPSSHQFRILSGTVPAAEKLVITSIKLQIRRLTLTNDTILSIERSLQAKPAQYPVQHAIIRTTQLTSNQTYLSNFVVHSGQMPRLVIVTLVESIGFTGSYIRNPFLFTLQDCTAAQIECNGRLYPPLPYTPKASMMDPYLNSLKIVNKLYSDSSTGLTLDDFQGKGHQILPFDLTPDDIGVPARTTGVVTFSAQWDAQAFNENHTVIFYLLFDNIISVDGRKNFVLDFVP